MIAALWNDWYTSGSNNPPEDIYIASSPTEITIRWQGEEYGGGNIVNFSATMQTNGNILLKYGDGNADGGMIGVSAGDGQRYSISARSWSGSMSNADDVVFSPSDYMTVSVPLVAETAPDRQSVNVRSVPPGSTVYVDYLSISNVTDVVVDWMDPASHSAAGWHSASHTIMLRGSGYRRSAPRYVPEGTNETHQILVHMSTDPEDVVDTDLDGLPDQWEDAYQLRDLAPGENGPDDDPDGDGATNEEELAAGTNPMDGSSVFRIPETQAQQPGEPFTILFNSVPGRTYVVMCADELGGTWIQASGLIVAESFETGWTTILPEGSTCQFFQVIVLAP